MRNASPLVLAAVLVGARWFCVSLRRAAPAMPLYGNVILAVAAVTFLVCENSSNAATLLAEIGLLEPASFAHDTVCCSRLTA